MGLVAEIVGSIYFETYSILILIVKDQALGLLSSGPAMAGRAVMN